MAVIRFDPGSARVAVGDWSAGASWVHRAPATPSSESAWRTSALVGVRRGVTLLVESEANDPTTVWAESWTGEPDESDALAVVLGSDGALLGVAAVPLCSCGDRGCGNTDVQFAHVLPASALPGLVLLLRDLPDIDVIPRPGAAWLGDLDEAPEAVQAALDAS